MTKIKIKKHVKDFKDWMQKKAGLSKNTADMYYKYISRTNTLPSPWETPGETINHFKKNVSNNGVKSAYRKFLAYLENTHDLSQKQLKELNFVENRLEKITVKKNSKVTKKELIQKYLSVPQIHEFSKIYKKEIGESNLKNFFEADKLGRGVFEFHLLPMFLFETGMRISEALNVKKKNIDFKEGKIDIYHGKGDKYRRVSMNKIHIDVHRLANCFEGGDLFLTENSKRFKDKLTYTFKNKIGEKYFGKPVTPHWFRHSWATNWAIKRIRQGGSKGEVIEEVRDYLGHSNRETSEIYLHAAEELLQDNVYSEHGGFETLIK